MTTKKKRIPRVNHKVETVPIGTPKPYQRNPRSHSDDQVDAIRNSIRRFGFIKPIVVDEHDVILAGHGAYQAARAEGLKNVPIIRQRHLTDAEKAAYRIADNKIALRSEWDIEALFAELDALDQLDDIGIEDAGFDADELARLSDDLDELRLGGDPDADASGTDPNAPGGPGGVASLSLVFSSMAARKRVYKTLNEAVEFYGAQTLADALDRVCKDWKDSP